MFDSGEYLRQIIALAIVRQTPRHGLERGFPFGLGVIPVNTLPVFSQQMGQAHWVVLRQRYTDTVFFHDCGLVALVLWRFVDDFLRRKSGYLVDGDPVFVGDLAVLRFSLVIDTVDH